MNANAWRTLTVERWFILGISVAMVACSGTDGDNGAGIGGSAAGVGGVGVSGSTSVSLGGNTSLTANTGALGGGTSAAQGGAASGGGSQVAVGGSSLGVGGATNAAGATSRGGSSATAGGAATTGGTTAKGGATSAGGTTAKGGATSTGGTTAKGGATSTGGTTAKGGATSTGGTTTRGGASSTSSAAGGSAAGGSAAGGSAAGGAAAGGAAAGGTTGVSVAPSCATLEATLKWPTSVGNKTISGTQKVTGVYDGGMALHQGTLNDCNIGDQNSTKPIFEIADGGTVQNVIFDTKVGDGIHCLGSCTIKNVWFNHVCDDAISVLGSGTVNISNSGFKYARDKTIQHNGTATVNIDTVYVETAGKLYRSCGDGCSTSTKRSATIKNVIAIGAAEVAGLSTNDKVTLSNICMYRTPKMCETFEPGSSTKTTIGANGTDEGPTANCIYTPADAHALVDFVSGAVPSQVMCPGPNSAAVGSNCIPGFETCLRNCTPGSYGFTPLTCSGGKYVGSTTCAMPKDTTAATNLNGATKAAGASGTQTKNNACSTQWAWGKDSAAAANYCVCVYKPGYYQETTGSAPPASWTVWDCAAPWWL